MTSPTAALAAGPAIANAAIDTARINDVGRDSMTALNGKVVKITGAGPNQTLTLRQADGTLGPVPCVYVRCDDGVDCKAYVDDLAGHRQSFTSLTPARCTLSSAPSRWGDRTAYGLLCDKPSGPSNGFDANRSGRFVRMGYRDRRGFAPANACL